VSVGMLIQACLAPCLATSVLLRSRGNWIPGHSLSQVGVARISFRPSCARLQLIVEDDT